MLVLRNKLNNEELKTEAPSNLYSTSYHLAEDKTWVFAFDSNAVLFSLPGHVCESIIEDVFRKNWEAKSVVGKYDIGINPELKAGWFEHHIYGEDQGGSLWFEDDELTDYDGVYSLPNDVVTGIEELGFIVSEDFTNEEEI